jgi:hypothetical protein
MRWSTPWRVQAAQPGDRPRLPGAGADRAVGQRHPADDGRVARRSAAPPEIHLSLAPEGIVVLPGGADGKAHGGGGGSLALV